MIGVVGSVESNHCDDMLSYKKWNLQYAAASVGE